MKDKEQNKLLAFLKSTDERYIAAFTLIVYIILLIPTVYLGKYNFMKADDFSFGRIPHRVYVETGSYLQALKAGFEVVKESYETWQGTFSSIFLMSTFPSVANYRFYKLVPAIMIFMITASVFTLSFSLVCGVLKNKKSYALIMGSVLSMIMVERMYTVPGALYWYNAAVHYTFAQCSFFLLVSVYINILRTKSTALKVLLCILSLILSVEIGGSNYSTVLIAGTASVSLFVIMLIAKKKKALIMLPSIVTLIIAIIINVTAPGNRTREAYYAGLGPVKSVLLSFKSFFVFSFTWTDFFTIVLFLMMIPILWNIVSKTDFEFKYPYLVVLLSIGIIASGFTSSYYGMGNEGLSRTHNVIKETWQILLFFNEAYIIGFVRKRFLKDKKDLPLSIAMIVVCYALVLLQPAFVKKLGTITSYTAFEYLHYGHAGAFWNENMERLAILEDESVTDAVLKPHSVKPFYLYVSDITDDPSNWENLGMSGYYGKNSVKLSDE